MTEKPVSPHGNKCQDTSSERLITMLTTAVGPQLGDLLRDDQVVEVMLNPDGKLWVDRLGTGRACTGLTVCCQDAERIIKLVASGTGGEVNEHAPILSAEFPGTGSRFQGLLPPVVTAPVFTIRKKALMIFSLAEYVTQGILTEGHKEVLIRAVAEKKNILITGGTGSGKTTLVNAILDEIARSGDRIVIIEDTLELQCSAPDTVFLRAREGVASMNDLLKATMRLRPDRIVVGEVRGGEALSLLKAWNTGHPGGCATVHANNAMGGLIRLEQLIQEAAVSVSKDLVAAAVDIIVHVERCGNGRIVREVVEVFEVQDGKYRLTAAE
ncbi:P-type conjugative transfer ATPase TrbB [Geomonas paludis]|uniref:P-type conjugative transfer ATPase TrbB n=1 Tax=Geomonas paludis TaxID=2740185 RepID=A0ABY4LN01_9BACT|nr:P-type conjugative transfer ATPase TrbB [Geomonas paludis]UPU37868.1 P-type conjugative transfer ATPase TrbB [Geomonas paludis]